jgi:hypothetical protein
MMFSKGGANEDFKTFNVRAPLSGIRTMMLDWNEYRAALKSGASKDEIAEALGVAIALGAGSSLVYATRVMDAVAVYPGAAEHMAG